MITLCRSCTTFTCLMLLCLLPFCSAQEVQEGADDDPILKKGLELMSKTVVNVVNEDGKQHAAVMQKRPVFRYGDERQNIGDSTIWVWMDKGRPVAIQKLEVNKYFKPAGWTYCFSALGDTRIEVKWPNVSRSYKSQKPIEFHPIPNAPKPASGTRLKFQSRALSRQFTSSMGRGKNIHQLRLVPNPLIEYKSEKQGILSGAVYNLATGTNPSIFLIIELRETATEPAWHYAWSRATSSTIRLNHGETEVYTAGPELKPGQFPTWTYLWMGGSK